MKRSCKHQNGRITLMNEDPQHDQIILAQLRNTASLSTIQAVIKVMQDLDVMLLDNDGVKWFNLLCLSAVRLGLVPLIANWY
jgi:hypothetical protein